MKSLLLKFFSDPISITFIVLFVVSLFFFLREFKIGSKQSWLGLLGFAIFGGFFAFQSWRRKQLLSQLEEREKALGDLEKKYDKLKEEAKLTEEAYTQAKTELENARLENAKAILRADAELQDELHRIETEYKDLSVDESIAKIKQALQR
jgi:hypothetical protein